MEQRLIVEGKDAIPLSVILHLRGLQPPKGYEDKDKYTKEFVKVAEGKANKLFNAIRENIESVDVTNIGVVLDANAEGAQAKLQSLTDFLNKQPGIKIEQRALSAEGIVLKLFNDLTFGIWIMPNNHDQGYLEHFLAMLIPAENETWRFAKEKITELQNENFCEFTEIAAQKALLHTYLAWQKKPGLPFGTALTSKYFAATSPKAKAFANWFQNTFTLSDK